MFWVFLFVFGGFFSFVCFLIYWSTGHSRLILSLCQTPKWLRGLENVTRASIDCVVQYMGEISALGELSL